MSFRPQPEPTPTLPDVFLKTIRLPRDLDFEGVSELKIVREGGLYHPASRPADLGARSRSLKKPNRTLWWNVGTLSAMKVDLTCEQDLHARHQHLLVHHARAVGSGAEAPGAGGAA